jgi:hypothetical protein
MMAPQLAQQQLEQQQLELQQGEVLEQLAEVWERQQPEPRGRELMLEQMLHLQ